MITYRDIKLVSILGLIVVSIASLFLPSKTNYLSLAAAGLFVAYATADLIEIRLRDGETL